LVVRSALSQVEASVLLFVALSLSLQHCSYHHGYIWQESRVEQVAVFDQQSQSMPMILKVNAEQRNAILRRSWSWSWSLLGIPKATVLDQICQLIRSLDSAAKKEAEEEQGLEVVTLQEAFDPRRIRLCR
jgi:hypothetical protein